MQIRIGFSILILFLMGCDGYLSSQELATQLKKDNLKVYAYEKEDPLPSWVESIESLIQEDSLSLEDSPYAWAFQELQRKGKIDSSLKLAIVRRFHYYFPSFRGGVAWKGKIFLEKTYLDWLFDLSAYFAKKPRLGHAEVLDSLLDNLYSFHISKTDDSFLYPLRDMNQEEQKKRRNIFENLVASLFFHEFGHTYLGHSPEWPLGDAQQEKPIYDREIDCDRIAGMLLAKGHYSLEWALFSLDLLAYYAEKGNHRMFKFREVQRSSFQSRQFQSYPSLEARKIMITKSYEFFQKHHPPLFQALK